MRQPVCSIIELGVKTKHLMTAPTRNSEFYLLPDSPRGILREQGKQNSLLPLSSVKFLTVSCTIIMKGFVLMEDRILRTIIKRNVWY